MWTPGPVAAPGDGGGAASALPGVEASPLAAGAAALARTASPTRRPPRLEAVAPTEELPAEWGLSPASAQWVLSPAVPGGGPTPPSGRRSPSVRPRGFSPERLRGGSGVVALPTTATSAVKPQDLSCLGSYLLRSMEGGQRA